MDKKVLPNIKIIEYNEIYDKEINDFVNLCMHIFIGRPFKQRNDLINIKDYYIKNGGNFWIALDNDKIIGTIAIENRGNIGILKRFYVDTEYQNLGIGNSLYNIFEDYVKNNTTIKTLYLACGRVLTNAHKFYKKNNWIQIDQLEIDMHVSIDDDFFKKDL